MKGKLNAGDFMNAACAECGYSIHESAKNCKCKCHAILADMQRYHKHTNLIIEIGTYLMNIEAEQI